MASAAMLAGLGLAGRLSVAGLVGIGSVSMTLYVFHARRTGSPVLDFTLLRLPTLRAAIIGGFMFRLRLRGARVRLRGRRDGDEDVGRAHHPRLRLPQHDDG